MTIDAESRLRARSIECLFEGVPGVDPLVSLNQPLSEALTSLSDVELDLNETLWLDYLFSFYVQYFSNFLVALISHVIYQTN